MSTTRRDFLKHSTLAMASVAELAAAGARLVSVMPLGASLETVSMKALETTRDEDPMLFHRGRYGGFAELA